MPASLKIPMPSFADETDIKADSAMRPLRPKGNARRNAIMDSAEVIFAERGYFGCSMRDISTKSGASLGVINHYFISKEILFCEIIDRKLPLLENLIRSALDEVSAKNYSGRDVIMAFTGPFFRACVDERDGIKYYIKLISHFMIFYSVKEVSGPMARLLSITEMFYAALRSKMPDCSESDIRLAIYLIEAALIFMVQDAGFLDRVTMGKLSAKDIDELIDPAVSFFAAGSRHLCEGG